MRGDKPLSLTNLYKEIIQMKKQIAILMVLMLVASSAFAAMVPTVTSRQRYEAADGTTYERVLGTLAFDSAYHCFATTKICGEPLNLTNLGLSAISRFAIDPGQLSVAN